MASKPGDFDILFHSPKLPVPCVPFGVFYSGKSGGKAVGIGHPLISFQPGGLTGIVGY